jgi:hypothetical protein
MEMITLPLNKHLSQFLSFDDRFQANDLAAVSHVPVSQTTCMRD